MSFLLVLMAIDEKVVDPEREFKELKSTKIKIKKERRIIPKWFWLAAGLTIFSAYETIDNIAFEGRHSIIKNVYEEITGPSEREEWYENNSSTGQAIGYCD
ncbi:hypothetical protein HQ533_03230 [Candidatus Woesearchaeota archaeon]|nr:hypothetical protein [Candidatus Woesearchaeota archaeon]